MRVSHVCSVMGQRGEYDREEEGRCWAREGADRDGAGGSGEWDVCGTEREIVVYWYSFSNHRTVCIHYGFGLVGNNLNNTLRAP